MGTDEDEDDDEEVGPESCVGTHESPSTKSVSNREAAEGSADAPSPSAPAPPVAAAEAEAEAEAAAAAAVAAAHDACRLSSALAPSPIK